MDNIRRIHRPVSKAMPERRHPESRPPARQVNQAAPQKRQRPPAPSKVREKRVHERLAKFDVPFFIITLVLMVFGLVMLLSASSSFAAREHDDSYYFFNRQVVFAGFGLIIMIVISFINYRILLDKKVVVLLAGASVAMMLATRLGLGSVEQGGATRWLGIGSLTFQPSEILKFTLIVVLAYVAHNHFERLGSFKKGFVPFVAIAGVACGLMVLQRHLSGTIIMFAIGATLILISPVRARHICITILVLAIIAGLAALAVPIIDNMSDANVSGRLQSWQDPESDITDKTFQTYQSLVTIGSGGWFGLGLGNSRQKFAYLPAAQNDFVFSVICEELGFVGGILVLLLFVVFILRGFYIAMHARDRFGMMLAAGITAQIGIQAFLNIAVVTNSVPNTGITLPFFSYGGTAMVMLLAQLGVLLNISRKAAIK
jgi:cell division protein FtsW